MSIDQSARSRGKVALGLPASELLEAQKSANELCAGPHLVAPVPRLSSFAVPR